MRMIQTECAIVYEGRGHTELGRGIRTILVKDDNTVIIHRKNGVKPTNYMGSVLGIDTSYCDGVEYLTVFSNKELLSISIYRTIQETAFRELPDDVDIDREGTERQQQEWLSRHFHVFGEHMRFVQREFQTGDGAIDLLGVDDNTYGAVLIEVKRKAVKHDVYQVIRYRDAVMRVYDERDTGFFPASAHIDLAIPPVFILASENDSDAVLAECAAHGITHVNTGTQWRRESVDSITARRVK